MNSSTASAIHHIPGKPGHFILKENLTNCDPVTFIYNLTVCGRGMGITQLVPANAAPSDTASVAARGGRKDDEMAYANRRGHMLVKVPSGGLGWAHWRF